MTITVKYFASLRERIGQAETLLPYQGIATVTDVWKSATQQSAPANTLVAVNMEYAHWDSAVKDGDEIAFFPPVTGG